MSTADLASLKAPLVSAEVARFHHVVSFCKFVRDNSIRTEQDLVAKHGLSALRSHQSSLGSDAYALAEQVCIACLDTHNFFDAKYCLEFLEKQFGEKSVRVLRLRGMLLEFTGQATKDEECLTAAVVVYQSLLERDPTDILTLKRQIAMAKSQGFVDKTIKLLTEYLSLFASDFEAWLELSALYLEHDMYQGASFCFEELITLQPQNYHLYVKYGEILATLGGLDNLIAARKQFTFSLELSKVNNLRAWWGIVSTTQGICSAKNVSSKNIAISVSLHDLATEEIKKAIKATPNETYALASLEALAPSAQTREAAKSYSASAKDPLQPIQQHIAAAPSSNTPTKSANKKK